MNPHFSTAGAICLVAVLLHAACSNEPPPPRAPGGAGGSPPTAGAGGTTTGGGTGGTTGGSTAPDAAAQGGAPGAGGGGVGGGPGGNAGAAGQGDAAGPPPQADARPVDAAGGPPIDAGSTMPADTWESYARGFFVTYCVSCHDDDNRGDAQRDYHLLNVVKAERTAIGCGVAKSQADWSQRGCAGSPRARQFPAGNGAKPSDADRDRLLRWLDANTP